MIPQLTDAAKDGRGTMGPPPDPIPPALILEPEVDALLVCFKNAIVNAGQIHRFFADIKRLGVEKHAPRPPQSLTNALGHEVEKYDQLCDAIESQLLRAISVLERDLAREERRFEESKNAAVSEETHSKPSSPSPSVPPTTAEVVPADTTSTTVNPPSSIVTQSNSPIPPVRRPSIFLSSLQRPLPPPKLDLSALSRMPTEDASLFSGGLRSPVTLAPRSARPMAANELPRDLMAFAAASGSTDRVGGGGAIDMVFTVPDETRASAGDMSAAGAGSATDVVDAIMLDSALGSSADKPIELDLMTDLFGDATAVEPGETDGLFSPSSAGPDLGLEDGKGVKKDAEEEEMGMQLFDALRHTDDNQDLFASLTAVVSAQQEESMTAEPLGVQSTSGAAIVPSPGSLLASLGASASMNVDDGDAAQDLMSDAPFDFDLAELDASIFSTSPPPQGMSFEELFGMGGQDGLDTSMGDEDGVLGP